MKDFFIDPKWFYWVDTVNNLKIFFLVICLLAFFSAVYCTFYLYTDKVSETAKALDKFRKFCIILTICTIPALIFTPSKTTCIEMMVSQSITESGDDLNKGEVKEIIDYMFAHAEKTR